MDAPRSEDVVIFHDNYRTLYLQSMSESFCKQDSLLGQQLKCRSLAVSAPKTSKASGTIASHIWASHTSINRDAMLDLLTIHYSGSKILKPLFP